MLERANIRSRTIGIEPGNLLPYHRSEGAGILRAAHRENQAAIPSLIMRQIIFGLRLQVETAMPHVAHDADDGNPFHVWLSRITKRDAFANGVLVRKPFLRERTVDDRNVWAVKLIAVIKESPLQKRDLRSEEIFRGDVAN